MICFFKKCFFLFFFFFDEQVHPEGKFVVDIDKNIDMNSVTPNCRVALRNDSYVLHKILPNKVRESNFKNRYSTELKITKYAIHIEIHIYTDSDH